MPVNISCTVGEAIYLKHFLEKQGEGGKKIYISKGCKISPRDFQFAYNHKESYARLFYKPLNGENPLQVESDGIGFYLENLLKESLNSYRKAEKQDLSSFDFNFWKEKNSED